MDWISKGAKAARLAVGLKRRSKRAKREAPAKAEVFGRAVPLFLGPVMLTRRPVGVHRARGADPTIGDDPSTPTARPIVAGMMGATKRERVIPVLGAPASRETPTQPTPPSSGACCDTLTSPHFLAPASAHIHPSGKILIHLAKPFSADGRAK